MTKPETLDSSERVELGRRWLLALTAGSREIVTLFDAEARVRFLSNGAAVQRLLGHDAMRLAKTRHLDMLHPDDRTRLAAAFRALRDEPGARQTLEYRFRHAAGHWVTLQSTALNLLADPVVGSIVVHTREARRRRLSGRGAAASADVHVRDRRGFIEAVEQAVDRARLEERYGFAVLLVELERHKMLVGSFGQELVDRLLGEVIARLSTLLRPADILGHLGGGELALLLDGIRDRRRAAAVADRIQRTLSARFHIDGQDISTGAIVGIATSERTYDKPEDVVRDAALAATRARGGGRRRRAVFQTQMRVEDSRVLSMVSALHAAMQEQQFRLHYQPIVALGSRMLTGFEALLRWNHPEHGVVPPDQFIPLAEESGMIVQIGEWVLNEACRQMVEWNQRYRPATPLSVSVNLSAKQIAEEDLSNQVERALDRTGLDARQLKLEVTETAVLDSREVATHTMQRLKQRGVRMSLDDFGTGYSSFSYLHQLPYDTLKVDRSFVAQIGDSGESSEIVHAIITLAHNLRMEVVAEGVETAAQAAQLNSMWCEYAQGFFFAKAVDAATAGEMIASPPRW